MHITHPRFYIFSCIVVIGQRLIELCVTDSCHPSMQVIAIALLVVAITSAVQFLVGKAAEFVVTICSQCNSATTIQFVCYLCWACSMVVGIGQFLGASGLSACCMHMLLLQWIA